VLKAWLNHAEISGSRRSGRREALNERGRARPFESTCGDHDSPFADRASLDLEANPGLEFVVPAVRAAVPPSHQVFP